MNPDDALYPCSFVIFGATGHLAATKLLPALYRLELDGRLPEVTNFIAFARRDWADADWKAHMEQALRPKLGQQFTPECFARFGRSACSMCAFQSASTQSRRANAMK